MTRQEILEKIRDTASENGGAPLGRDRFEQVTGIRYVDWYGKHWVRWGDAIREAGLSPNAFQQAYDKDALLQKLIALIRELGHYPVSGDLRMKKGRDPSFPNDKAFYRHFGSSKGLRKAVLEYCNRHEGFGDVVPLCGTVPPDVKRTDGRLKTEVFGFVYMMKLGKHYKIGKTNAIGRREYELGIQLFAKPRTVHVIKTDDPDGIERYWHQRFALKRGNGEWFILEPSDVQAFKRRKFM